MPIWLSNEKSIVLCQQNMWRDAKDLSLTLTHTHSSNAPHSDGSLTKENSKLSEKYKILDASACKCVLLWRLHRNRQNWIVATKKNGRMRFGQKVHIFKNIFLHKKCLQRRIFRLAEIYFRSSFKLPINFQPNERFMVHCLQNCIKIT